MRRFTTIALSLSVLIGLSTAGRLMGQDPKPAEEKKADAPKVEEKKAETPKAEEKKAEEAKPAAPAEAPLPSIPPEVQAKREAALKAIAEFVVAAQDAKLVETTIDPPPVLDLLVTGRAIDARDLKARKGVSPEVFAAWFTGYGKMDGIVPQSDVRIVQPSKGLKDYYDQRSNLLSKYIDDARKAKTEAPKAEEKKPETPKAEEKKPEAPKAEEKKPEAPKAEEKKPEAPKAEEKKPEAPKAEEKKPEDAPKPAEAPKPEAPKAEAPKADAPKTEAPKAEEALKPVEAPKAEAPKAEAPKAEAPKAEAPKAEEAPKPADAPKVEEAPKTEDKPKA